MDGYTKINLAPQGSGTCAVTLVTTSGADGDTSGGDSTDDGSVPAVVPLPAAGWMLLDALGGLLGLRRRSA
ncbi:MAG: VPLPA-CTERM sorting domain-containing protein [Pseudomonadota bacterium]